MRIIDWASVWGGIVQARVRLPIKWGSVYYQGVRPLIVFVDVDDTLIRSFGSKRIPMVHVVEHVRELSTQGARLYCWSSGGAEYARESARELGLDDVFEGFLPKPNVMVDDVPPKDWPSLVVSHPATVRGVTYSDYRERAFPEDLGIKVLTSAVDHIRMRPGMYVGDTGQTGLQNLANWLLRDCFAPLAVEARPRSIRVNVLAPNHLEIVDDRRHSEFTKEKFRNHAERLFAPCTHPFGDFVVANALSDRFELELWFEGEGWLGEYRRGRLERGPYAIAGLPGSGTRVRFQPDPEIFESVEFDMERLSRRLDEFAGLYSGIEVRLEGLESAMSWKRPAGLADWIGEWRPEIKGANRVFHGVVTAQTVRCEVAWRWSEDGSRAPLVRSWVNGVETKEGGSHAASFVRSVLSQPEGEGKTLVGAVQVALPLARFKSPGRSELDMPEIEEYVRAAVCAARLDSPR